jgi:hypothetical protein
MRGFSGPRTLEVPTRGGIDLPSFRLMLAKTGRRLIFKERRNEEQYSRIRKQHAFSGQVFQHVQSLRAQVDKHGHAGFLAGQTHRVIRPVHIRAFQIRNVALARAQPTAPLSADC